MFERVDVLRKPRGQIVPRFHCTFTSVQSDIESAQFLVIDTGAAARCNGPTALDERWRLLVAELDWVDTLRVTEASRSRRRGWVRWGQAQALEEKNLAFARLHKEDYGKLVEATELPEEARGLAMVYVAQHIKAIQVTEAGQPLHRGLYRSSRICALYCLLSDSVLREGGGGDVTVP